MTTLTMPTHLQQAAHSEPLPWRRMVWVTWRQHRAALIGVALLLGAVATYVWIVGLDLHHAYAAAVACQPANSISCGALVGRFDGMNKVLQNGFVLLPLPALIGAFLGAPILSRELETGTFRYAWTQGFGRWRWTLAKLVMLAAIVVVVAGAMSALFTWYYEPYVAAGNRSPAFSQLSPFGAGLFDVRGIAFVAWTLLAFALGGLAGMLIRRVVPAIVATLAVYTGLALVTGNILRQHYRTALATSSLNVPASAWITRQWGTKGGKVSFTGGAPLNLLERLCPPSTVGRGKPSSGSLAQCITGHGYTLWTAYQPASRFWPFQWIEGGWLLALSVLLIAVTVWLVRRRAA
jgi:hypothetical protein